MELKLLANTEPRKKFHMTRKLQKAVVYAEELNNLCEMDRVDARTKLESQVSKDKYIKGYNIQVASQTTEAAADWGDNCT